MEKETKKKQTKVLGLKGRKLEASLQRKFTYPFVFKGSSKQKEILLNNSNKLGISFQEGGRVINLGDKVTKGLALKKIVKPINLSLLPSEIRNIESTKKKEKFIYKNCFTFNFRRK